MSTKFVQHDERRWRIVAFTEIDGEEAYELVRRTPRSVNIIARCVARVADCQPDAHEPRRVFKDTFGSLVYYPKRGVIEVREKHARRPFVTSISGILALCARQKATNAARERAFKRRTKGR